MRREAIDAFVAVPAELDLPQGHLNLRREHLVGTVRAEVSKRRLRPRPIAIAAVVVFTAIATPAFGLSDRIRDLFEGAPSPPSVAKSFAIENELARAQGRGLPNLRLRHPQVDPSTAHGVISVPTGDGTLHLWAANQLSGSGVCWFISWAADESPPASAPGGAAGGGSCSEPTSPRTGVQWGYGWGETHLSLDQISGYVYPDAVTVEVSLADGTTDTFPVVEHLFLGVLPRGSRVTRLRAFDAAGAVVGGTGLVSGAAP